MKDKLIWQALRRMAVWFDWSKARLPSLKKAVFAKGLLPEPCDVCKKNKRK